MEFTEVLTAVREWLAHVPLPAQINRDTDDGLWAYIETENALAELLAGEGAYAPYRFVSFTVLDTRLDLHAEPVFSFCDDESHTIADILRELDRGMAVMGMLTGSQ